MLRRAIRSVVRNCQVRGTSPIDPAQNVSQGVDMSLKAALHRSEALNRAVLNALPAQIAVLNRNGTILAVNEAWSQSATDNGASAVIRAGIGVNYLDACRQEALAGDASAAQALAGTQAVLDGSQAHFALEYPCHSPTEQRWFMMSVTPLAHESGGATIVHADITQHKRAQEALARAESLRIEIAREREIIDLKQRLVSMVSHDLRNPLTVIALSSHNLVRYFERLTSEQRLEYLHMIEPHIKHMGELLDEVLMLGDVQAEKLAFNPSPLDLESFCRDVFQQMRLTDMVGHQFRFVAEGDFGHVSVDEKIVRHILINLLSNAIKYSPSDTEIRLELSQDEQAIILHVSDQGIGIPAEDQAKVFEAFYRAPNARFVGGTGLGLAIVRSNVEAHGGTIAFESKQGQGTTFIVRLPVGT